MNLPAKRLLLSVLSLGFLSVLIYSCKHEPTLAADKSGGYPDEIAKIMVNRCASCHNDANASGAASLRLDSWDHLFYGSSHGAVVIPYDIENSSLLYYINTDTSLGLVAYPTMPFDPVSGNPQNHLTKDEYLTIRNWIAAGAPDRNGVIPFASNPDTRQKFYLTEQGCDILTVVDAERKVIMRNIKIGESPQIESSHCVRVSNDGAYAYVSFLAGDYIQKIDTRTDQIVGRVKIISPKGSAQWNVLHISDDGSKLIVSDLIGGILKVISTADMQEIAEINNTKSRNPHGIASNAAFDTFYVTAQYGNKVYRMKADGYVQAISLNGSTPIDRSTYDPHEIMMTPDGSKYFLTCEFNNKIMVMNTYTDKAIDSFDVPTKPQEIAISHNKPYMFFSCMEGPVGNKTKGAVVVINYETMKVVKTITGRMFQPHGLTVDDQRNLLFVASRNADSTGSAPHHSTNCGGRNGYYTIYDIKDDNMAPINDINYEVMRDPYSADVRFKK